MLIITKHKDYYDYLQGIYGVDNNKVYKRENYLIHQGWVEPLGGSYKTHCFAINNKTYFIYEIKSGFYVDKRPTKWDLSFMFREPISEKTDINIKKRKPIVYGRLRGNKYEWWSGDPIMQSFDFYKILTAEQMYIEVETFLGYLKDHPEIPNKQTNVEKLESHGFDKKISFRHRK